MATSGTWRRNGPPRESPEDRTQHLESKLNAHRPVEQLAQESQNPRTELPFRKVPPVHFAKRTGPDKGKQKETNKNVDEIQPAGPAYTLQSALDKAERVGDLATQIMKTPITVETSDLLSLSPELRKEVTKWLAKKCIATKEVFPNEESLDQALHELMEMEVEEPREALPPEEDVPIELTDLPVAKQFTVTVQDQGRVPAGSCIVHDPVLQYLATVPSGEEPRPIYVAKESQALRSVYPMINGVDTEECVLDGGSQIVSMAWEVALKLGLSWDPDVVINMQSANKQVEKTLGLARNVPFLFEDITVYLQVHIIRDPAYRVLMGLPFFMATESILKSNTDGGQTVTLTDPNSGSRRVIPTFSRGGPPKIAKNPAKTGFQDSRI